MKNSKLVVSTSAFVLAIVGAFAFKSHNSLAPVSGYTKADGCTQKRADVNCSVNFSGALCSEGVGKTLYTKGCVNSLHTQG